VFTPLNDATCEELAEMLSMLDSLPSEELGYFYAWVHLTMDDIYGGVEPVNPAECIRVLHASIELSKQSGIV
jgi:hypothetical protein